jgi:hypothetical protein
MSAVKSQEEGKELIENLTGQRSLTGGKLNGSD